MIFSLIAFTMNAFALDINVDKYHSADQWQSAPTIVVCNNSPVTVNQVKKAANAWKAKGIKLGDVRKQNPGECGASYTYRDDGSILIAGKLRFLDKVKYNGWTVRYTGSSNKTKIVTSICEINSDTVKEKPAYVHQLLVHEIGHALGYPHQSHSKNDVMTSHLSEVN